VDSIAFRENCTLQGLFQELSAPLATYYDCTFLTYRRFYPNGKMIYFINNDKWLDYSFQHQIWASKNAVNRVKKAYKEGSYYYIWPIIPNNHDQVYSKLYEYNIWKGISIYKRYGECVEAFCFISIVDTDKVVDLYINNQNVLDRFCQYFKNRTKDIINKSSTHSLLCSPVNSFTDNSINTHHVSQDFIDATPIKNYFLRIKTKDISLSIQETKCLFFIAQGKSMKEIANINNISVRTVETHLNNIKKKTDCFSTSQLISHFYNSNINILIN
jgi:DNA-binding CsgD family transcriptional regulator